MRNTTLESYLSTTKFSQTSKESSLFPFNYMFGLKVDQLINLRNESRKILGDLTDKIVLDSDDNLNLLGIYLSDSLVQCLIDFKRVDINEFVIYGIENFGSDNLGYFNVLNMIESEDKNIYLSGKLTNQNYDLLHPVRDVNLYLDKIRQKKYDLEEKKDFEIIFNVIKKVSFFAIGDYKNEEFGRVDNEGFYDVFGTMLSLDNYDFLYQNYYKYDGDYLSDLCLDKYKVESGYLPGIGCALEGNSARGVQLALPILADFSKLFNLKKLQEISKDKAYFNFIMSNINEFDLENTDIPYKIFLDFIDKKVIYGNDQIFKILLKGFEIDLELTNKFCFENLNLKIEKSEKSQAYYLSKSFVFEFLEKLMNNEKSEVLSYDLVAMLNSGFVADVKFMNGFVYGGANHIFDHFINENYEQENEGRFVFYEKIQKNILLYMLFEASIDLRYFYGIEKIILNDLIDLYHDLTIGEYKDYIFTQIKIIYKRLDDDIIKNFIDLHAILLILSENYGTLSNVIKNKYIDFLKNQYSVRDKSFEIEEEFLNSKKENTNTTFEIFLKNSYLK